MLGALGCQTTSLDFKSPDAAVAGGFELTAGESMGVTNDVLIVRPTPSGEVAFTMTPTGLSPKWSPIIDIGIGFSNIERHEVAVFWRGAEQEFSDERSVRDVFNLKYIAGGVVRQRLTLNLAANPGWQGEIAELKVVVGDLLNPVEIEFVPFPESKPLSLLMPHRKWLGLDKRIFLAYFPVAVILLLCMLNVWTVMKSEGLGLKSKLLDWQVNGRSANASVQVLFWGLSLIFVLNAVFPFDSFPYLRFPFAGERIVYPEMLLGLLIILLASLIGPRILSFSATEWAFMGFFAAVSLSFRNAHFLNYAMSRTLFYIVPIPLFLALGRGILHTKRGFILARRFSIVIMASAFWVSFHGVMEGLFNHNYLLDTFYRAFAPIYVEYTFGMPIASSFVDPSVLGSFIVMCVPIALFFTLYEKQNRALRIFAFISLIVFTIALIYACSYGSLVAIFVAMALYFLRKSKRLLIGLAIAGTIAVIIATVLVIPRYREYMANVKEVDRLIREQGLSPDEIVELAGKQLDHTLLYSVNQRVDGALSALRMLSDYPICGVGIGNFEPQFDDYYRRNPESLRIYKVPDNVLFMVLAETGILGLLAFLAFVLVVARGCIKALKATEGDRYWDNYVWAMCIAAVGFGVNCLAYDGMFWFSPSFAFWAMLGMLLPLAQIGQRKDVSRRR